MSRCVRSARSLGGYANRKGEAMDSRERLVQAALALAEEFAELRQQQPRFPGPSGLWPSDSDRLLHEYIQARDAHESKER